MGLTFSKSEDLSPAQKEELIASLSCLAIGGGELTAEKLQAVATASGNKLPDGMAALFANVVSKSKDGMKTFTPPPGGGGGGGDVGGGDGAAKEVVEEEPEEEEEAQAPAGGDLFGDGGDGGDY